MMAAYNAGQTDLIISYNANDVNIEWILYELIEACKNTEYIGESFGVPPKSPEVPTMPLPPKETELVTKTPSAQETWIARCPKCLSEEVESTDNAEHICSICGFKIKRM